MRRSPRRRTSTLITPRAVCTTYCAMSSAVDWDCVDSENGDNCQIDFKTLTATLNPNHLNAATRRYRDSLYLLCQGLSRPFETAQDRQPLDKDGLARRRERIVAVFTHHYKRRLEPLIFLSTIGVVLDVVSSTGDRAGWKLSAFIRAYAFLSFATMDLALKGGSHLLYRIFNQKWATMSKNFLIIIGENWSLANGTTPNVVSRERVSLWRWR